MTDINFSYSTGSNQQTSPAGAMTWSYNGVALFPGPANTSVAYRSLSDTRMILQPELAAALQQCQQFRTLEAHSQTLMQSIPALRDHPQDVLATLKAVCDAGIFESSAQAWQRLAQSAGQSASPECTVFILTCDRPAALSRVLDSLLAQIPTSDVRRVCVIDDSRQPDSITENARLIAQAQDLTGLQVSHFDLAARQKLISELVAELPEYEHDIQFLLSREEWEGQATYGLARNLALLLSAGQHALLIDDDVIPEAINPPLASTTLTVGTANDRQAVFYQDPDDLDRHALALPEPAITEMLSGLGMPLGDLLTSSLPGHTSLAGWNGDLLAHLGSHSPILMTQCGSWGDPGTGSSDWTLFLQPASIERLLTSGSDLETLLAQRCSWYGYRGPTLSQYGTLSQMTGIANTTLPPPYMPAGRGEDILFGLMLQRMYPDSAVLNHGWAVRHAPIEDRHTRGTFKPLSVAPNLGLLGDWLGREPADQWGQKPEANLRAVGEQIQRLSSIENAALQSLIRQELVSKASFSLQQCFMQLETAQNHENAPGYAAWQAHLESTRDQLVHYIQTPRPTLFEAADSDSTAINQYKALGRRYASAVRVWPEIWQAARALPLQN